MFLLGIGMQGVSVCTTWKIVASLTANPDPTGLQTGINGGQRPVSTVVGGFNRTSYGKSYLGYSAGFSGGLLVAETSIQYFFCSFLTTSLLFIYALPSYLLSENVNHVQSLSYHT